MNISVIGLGMSPRDLTSQHLSLIETADVLAGGERHLSYFPDFSGEKIEIKKNVRDLPHLLLSMQKTGKRVVVLASGDPLFYGIGAYLIRKIGKEQITVYPNISSVSAAFSRIGESWSDAQMVSFHGRPLEGASLNEFIIHDKLAILTDSTHTPERIVEKLAERGMTGFNICVLENLGETNENISWFNAGETVSGPFSEPNLMIFLREKTPGQKDYPVSPGMADDMFAHERGLITKPEIRVISLAKLMLETGSILWDLGAGSGSVSVEASFYIKKGTIYSVEKNESRVSNIRDNMKKFSVANMSVVHGTLPAKLDDLPDPDRIFIGGGGKDLPQIIEKSAVRLPPNGVMVVNTVLISSMSQSLEKMESMGLRTDIIQVQINAGHAMPHGQMLKSRNPVFIIQGIKK